MSALTKGESSSDSKCDLSTLVAEVKRSHRNEDRMILQNRLGSVSYVLNHRVEGRDELASLGSDTLAQRGRVERESFKWTAYPYWFAPDQKSSFRFIDLFCGIGGMRLAYQLSGGRPVFASDIDVHARDTYLANYGEMPFGDIRSVDPSAIPDHDILLAGFPCQAFSMAGQRKGLDDVRGTLVFSVAKILHRKRPAAFLLENVKGLTSHDHGGFKTLGLIRDALVDAGYTLCEPRVLNARDFGVAQNRERVFIVGFRDDAAGRLALERFAFPEVLPESAQAVLPLSSHLDQVVEYALSGDSVEERYFLSGQYLRTLERHRAHHRALGHGFGYHVFEQEDLATSCAHTLLLGGMGLERNLIRDWHKPIPSSRGRQRPMNEEGVRKLTPVECRRLQGFPDDFVLPGLGSARQGHLYRQFANSVAVPVIYSIAQRMTEALGYRQVAQTE